MEHERVTYNAGDTPDEVVQARSTEPYSMEIVDQQEIDAVVRAWNMGIDAHLEAITVRSRYELFERKLANGRVICGGVRFVLHPEELHVLLRRLWEVGTEEAWALRSSVLETLNIEEV